MGNSKSTTNTISTEPASVPAIKLPAFLTLEGAESRLTLELRRHAVPYKPAKTSKRAGRKTLARFTWRLARVSIDDVYDEATDEVTTEEREIGYVNAPALAASPSGFVASIDVFGESKSVALEMVSLEKKIYEARTTIARETGAEYDAVVKVRILKNGDWRVTASIGRSGALAGTVIVENRRFDNGK